MRIDLHGFDDAVGRAIQKLRKAGWITVVALSELSTGILLEDYLGRIRVVVWRGAESSLARVGQPSLLAKCIGLRVIVRQPAKVVV